ncbi:hypothetical protein PMIN06_004860 [Paraphaeosphaeria minitans]
MSQSHAPDVKRRYKEEPAPGAAHRMVSSSLSFSHPPNPVASLPSSRTAPRAALPIASHPVRGPSSPSSPAPPVTSTGPSVSPRAQRCILQPLQAAPSHPRTLAPSHPRSLARRATWYGPPLLPAKQPCSRSPLPPQTPPLHTVAPTPPRAAMLARLLSQPTQAASLHRHELRKPTAARLLCCQVAQARPLDAGTPRCT